MIQYKLQLKVLVNNKLVKKSIKNKFTGMDQGPEMNDLSKH